ncbi:hypothetical protein KR215_002456 [Drosophila sulfurigaster]|nr:hypothetical protein KR215_002456 [Drosophila sulfurigaster]
MLARKYELSPRVPPVHERIALQCAKNICKLAAALPKPRTLTGHLPVLVELRAQGEPNTVYRYQVNLPPSRTENDHLMQTDEAKALSNKLHLPCLVHDHQFDPNASPLAGNPPLEDPPQLVMVQESVHVVSNQANDNGNNYNVSTFQNNGYAIGATKTAHDHFMATLHEQQPSPLQFTMLWAKHNYDYDEQQLQLQYAQPLLMVPVDMLPTQLHVQPPKGIDQLPLQPRQLNGYKPTSSRKYSKPRPNNSSRLIFQPQPQSQPQSASCNFGFVSPQQLNASPSLYSSSAARNINLVIEPGEYTNGKVSCDPQQQQQHMSGDQIRSICRQLTRVLELGHPFEKRQQLEQNHTLTDQQKYKRIFDSLVTTQMPPELSSLFCWDCCHLCHTAMRTVRNALDHYMSRSHQRRVDSWLIRRSFAKGHNLSEDMLRHLRSSGPVVLHCDLCDLKLTSAIHARQHFDGRRHRLVERHISKPNGEGYYDKAGHWVRTNNKWLACKVCDVIVTSEPQLAIHMAGVRHRKRERTPGPFSLAEPYNGNHMYRIHPSGLLSPLNPSGNYVYAKPEIRKFNDPNATYYCGVCNITLNHIKSVKQHENGRTHNKKLGKMSRSPQVFLNASGSSRAL